MFALKNKQLTASGQVTTKVSAGTNTLSAPARVVGLRNPWIFLDLLDDGAIRGKLHVSQLGDGRQLSTDEFGLHLINENSKESDDIILSLGQKFPCRLRGLDLWSGELDLAPI